MMALPGGRFVQGSPADESGRSDDEGPLREVSIGPFALGKYEVTRGEYRKFVEATGYRTDAERNVAVHGQGDAEGCFTHSGGATFGWAAGTDWRDAGMAQDDRHPVACVSWNDAQAYVEWLRRETGQAYRLPSESEFEYANRAGTVTPWPWGTDPDGGCGHANYADADLKSRFDNFVTASCSDGHVFTAPAGSYPANGFGLYDMAGNVVEWTQDCWNAGYEGAPDDGKAWESGDCALRVMRGGSWGFGSQALRAAARFKPAAAGRGGRAGFRVARD